MTTAAIKHVAFFGATGGCTLAALDLAIQDARLKCHALVRNESKLREKLSTRKVPEDAIKSRLNIVTGDVKDVAAVRNVLFPSELNGNPVDVIISGIGGVPQFTWRGPTLEDPHICENGTKTILEGLASLKGVADAKKPRFCVISTTGLSQTRDVPHLMRPLYWVLLQIPMADKTKMEAAVLEDAGRSAAERLTASSVICRPSMLTNGSTTSLEQIRVGLGDDMPAVGYTISRDDVGLWLYHNVIHGDVKGVTSITY
ncbi:hypothetical protein SODALDRAFT_331199 [Sodiomyces alkalinus F11]|uniref:NAD(P)-binding domain-containing protein n=1 Tax=Sodiomyces alkalinus (strain CBS 110278 / VKM F-3762 / F11) TaxID=1314773 RepID=A0A3N2Q496_SODAK|nr:hypothetical protein SODALDRAFT_331199 [Sodiomyces alkalinus F11]ROT41468.1 hypothetical protein SODALDRAFT_331199 [Sodiomyces alkalinus F11]